MAHACAVRKSSMKRKYWELDEKGQVVIGEIEGDESGYEIRIQTDEERRTWELSDAQDKPYRLYQLAMYGGEPIFHWAYSSIQEAIKVAERWT